MSKALSGAALAGAAGGAAGAQTVVISGALIGLLAAGICALAGWVFLRVIRPEKLFLRRVPGRKNHLSPLHAAGLFIAFYACMDLGMRALARLWGVEVGPGGGVPMKVSLLAGIFAQLALIGGAATVAALTFRGGLRRGVGLSLRHGVCDSVRGAVACLAVLPLCYAALAVTQLLMPERWISEHPILTFVGTAPARWVAIALTSTVVLAPVAEELFFRGLIQSMLRRYGFGPWPAVLVASGVFAASHASQPQDLPALFVLGLALGYNYERTGRLVAPILLHALFNAAMIWITLAQ